MSLRYSTVCSLDRVLPLSEYLSQFSDLDTNVEHYPDLQNWRIDYSVSFGGSGREMSRTFIIGSHLTDDSNCSKCMMILGAWSIVYNLELDLCDECGNQLNWKDVKHLAYAEHFSTLFIATKRKVFGVILKLETSFETEFGKKNNVPLGKLCLQPIGGDETEVFRRVVFGISGLKNLDIQSIGATGIALFIVLSNGKLYSWGYNFGGGAARGQKNVHDVDMGECEVKLKGKKAIQPHFIKVVGFDRKVAALTSSGSIYLCGEHVLSIMGLNDHRNLFMFKEFELPNTRFIDVNFCTRGLVAITSDKVGLLVRKGCVVKLYGKVTNQSSEEDEDEEFENEHEDQSENPIGIVQKKVIKFMYHARFAIIIYNDNSVDITHKGTKFSFQFSCPAGYPNDGLNCVWFDESAHYNACFFWKFSKESYLHFEKFTKKLKYHSDNQLLTDVSFHF